MKILTSKMQVQERVVTTKHQIKAGVKNWGGEGEKVRLLKSRVTTAVTIYGHLPCFRPFGHIILLNVHTNPKSRYFVPILLSRVTQLLSKACATTTTQLPWVDLRNGAGLRMKGDWFMKGLGRGRQRGRS